MTQFKTHPVTKIQGEYLPPGDKSISHRLAMFGALAEGKSEFRNFLFADDCLNTIRAFQEMGVKFDLRENPASSTQVSTLTVYGAGLCGLKPPARELDMGNSGTSMRLLLGILAAQPFEVSLTGDRSLCKRPMRRVTEPLRRMGAKIEGREDANFAPLKVQGGSLAGIKWRSEVSSAQVKSAVLLAGLFAKGETVFTEPIPSRDHTERLLQMFGVLVKRSVHTVSVQKTERLLGINCDVPGDISSAAFFIVAALLLPGSDLRIKHVGLNPSRTGFIDVLKAMGANIEVTITEDHGEPLGEIHVRSSRLKGYTITKYLIPKLIDELPILMIAGALAEGESVIQGAEELRVKETDRIHSMVTGLNAIGGNAEERADGCVIRGVKEFDRGTVLSFGDHRTAMSFLIAGLRSKLGITIQDTDCIVTSYPGFMADLSKISKK